MWEAFIKQNNTLCHIIYCLCLGSMIKRFSQNENGMLPTVVYHAQLVAFYII